MAITSQDSSIIKYWDILCKQWLCVVILLLSLSFQLHEPPQSIPLYFTTDTAQLTNRHPLAHPEHASTMVTLSPSELVWYIARYVQDYRDLMSLNQTSAFLRAALARLPDRRLVRIALRTTLTHTCTHRRSLLAPFPRRKVLGMQLLWLNWLLGFSELESAETDAYKVVKVARMQKAPFGILLIWQAMHIQLDSVKSGWRVGRSKERRESV